MSYPTVEIHTSEGRVSVHIETERLSIRSYEPDRDYIDCVSLYGDPILTKYFDFGRPYTPEEVKEMTYERGCRFFRNGELLGLFSVFEKSSGSFIGQVDLLPTDEEGTVEIGYIFLRQFHFMGYCQEAIQGLISEYVPSLQEKRFFTNGGPIQKLVASAHPQNYASLKQIQKLGMSFNSATKRFGAERYIFSLTLPQKHFRKEEKIYAN
ncbi:MAG: GNAT family N-acetyltransferase [Chlamydiales bacterium]|nr:GNAT family N-acetyltransferase [Chlamydiales bacterium]